MRVLLVGILALVVLGILAVGAPFSPEAMAQGPATRPLVTPAEYERWQVELSNWGRWGKDDEMGTLNLITPAKRKAAAGLIREGVTVSLASNANTEKGPDVPCPVEWAMVAATEANAADRIGYPCIHGAGTTHLDSFAHRFFNGKMWNGYPVAGLVTMEGGAAKNSILTMKHGHRHARGALRHAEAQRCSVSRAGNPHLSRRPGSLGKEDWRESRGWGRLPGPLGSMGASRPSWVCGRSTKARRGSTTL